jgi:hypothetical protein
LYIIPVKIERLQKRQRSSGLLHVLAGFFLLVIGSFSINGFAIHPVILTIAVLSMIYGLFRRKIDPKAKLNPWLRLIQSAAFIIKAASVINEKGTIMAVSLFIWAGVTLMLGYVEMKMLKPTEIEVGENGIKIPGEFTDHLIPWRLVSGLILRQDYLTITREDKSYTQLELTTNLNQNTISEINQFAAERIEPNNTK